jgi:hypothetical protein
VLRSGRRLAKYLFCHDCLGALDRLCFAGFVLGFFTSGIRTASAIFLSIMLIHLAGFVSMRSLGETDNGAVLVIGTLISLSVKIS